MELRTEAIGRAKDAVEGETTRMYRSEVGEVKGEGSKEGAEFGSVRKR